MRDPLPLPQIFDAVFFSSSIVKMEKVHIHPVELPDTLNGWNLFNP